MMYLTCVKRLWWWTLLASKLWTTNKCNLMQSNLQLMTEIREIPKHSQWKLSKKLMGHWIGYARETAHGPCPSHSWRGCTSRRPWCDPWLVPPARPLHVMCRDIICVLQQQKLHVSVRDLKWTSPCLCSLACCNSTPDMSWNSTLQLLSQQPSDGPFVSTLMATHFWSPHGAACWSQVATSLTIVVLKTSLLI
jgi:hypothetical protein